MDDGHTTAEPEKMSVLPTLLPEAIAGSNFFASSISITFRRDNGYTVGISSPD